jgi:hypothetical protein
MKRTPTALITVASAMSTDPSGIPLAAPDAEVIDGSVPTSWNPDHTEGPYASPLKAVVAFARKIV